MGGGGGGIGGVLGAIGGAAEGMVAGPMGMLAGAGIGNSLGGGSGDLSDILGTKNHFNAQGVPIQTPTTNEMAKDQYGNVTNSIGQQQDFVNALNAQNGLGNQNAAFQMAMNQANGTGVNPAQAQLAQNTQANIAHQGALMAGQRGAGSNPALMARQIANQGAQTQQQSAGQAATLQAQQQLAAQQLMANIANQQVAQRQMGLQNYGQQAQGAYGQVSGNINSQNAAATGQNNAVNSVNAGVAAGNQNANNQLIGNVMGGVGSAMNLIPGGSMISGGSGGSGLGVVGDQSGPASMGSSGRAMAEGGKVEPSVWDNIKTAFDEPKKNEKPTKVRELDPDKAKAMSNFFNSDKYAEGGGVGPRSFAAKHFHGIGQPQIAMANGGKVPALVSPGEQYIPPKDLPKVAAGVNPLEVGERIPGKPKVKGNSYENDTVPKTLEEGGIVIPNSVMQSKHPQWAAHKFVAAHCKEQALKKGK